MQAAEADKTESELVVFSRDTTHATGTFWPVLLLSSCAAWILAEMQTRRRASWRAFSRDMTHATRNFRPSLLLSPRAAWVLAEMRAAEADKTESELAGVVRRLKPQQQGTRLDCAICLRKVPFAVTLTVPS